METGGAKFAGPGPSGKWQRLIQERMAKAAEPLQRLQGEQKTTQARQDLVRKLNSALTDLRDATRRLGDPATFRARQAQSGNPEALSVRAEGTADPGRHRVAVEHPASSHVHLVGVRSSNREQPAGVTDPTDPGQIRSGSTVSFQHNGTAFRYAADGETSLKGLAERIDADDNGVSARVTNLGAEDSPRHVLRLESDGTGRDSRILQEAGGKPGVQVVGPEGQAGSLFQEGALQQQAAQPGRDARFTVDGTPMERASNTVTDALPGVELTLRSATEGQVPVTVERSGQDASQAVQQFVERFNAVTGMLDQATRYDPQSGEAGPLHGDAMARQVSERLRQGVSDRLPGMEGNAFQSLSEVGVALQRDGSLAMDSGRLQQALQRDPEAVARLFSGEGGAAERLEQALAGLTRRGDGVVQARLDSLDARMDRLDGEIRDERADLQDKEADLKERFVELERTLAGFEGRKRSMEQAMAKLPGTGNGN
jgi:flagellar hook-associated protein 2